MTALVGVLAALLVLFAVCVPHSGRMIRFDIPPIGGDWFAPPPRDCAVRLEAHGPIFVDDRRASLDRFERIAVAFERAPHVANFHLHGAAAARCADFAALLDALSRNHARYSVFGN